MNKCRPVRAQKRKIEKQSEFEVKMRQVVITFGVLALAAVLMLFTFYPPHLPIFMDGQGFYGLP